MITLIGNKSSKRTEYFIRAARAFNEPVRLVEWDEIFGGYEYENFQGAVIKIDPPSYEVTDLAEMSRMLRKYQEFLKELGDCDCSFLNTPNAVLEVLDKRHTKEVLQKRKISVTMMFDEDICSVMQLFDMMRKNRTYSVFVKPKYFSGAAGVSAFRFNPANGKMKLYTSCVLKDGCLYNTKRLHQMENDKEIYVILEKLIELGIVVERWYPKDTLNGKIYDLRVVYQFGGIEHIVVRQSDGPVTNLHLNNQAAEFAELGLDEEKISDIDKLCQSAVLSFEGLNMAGVDVMLDKVSKKPRIIEINGQGDLIYQDIFKENKIYKHQVQALRS